jgi:hypothetical protein
MNYQAVPADRGEEPLLLGVMGPPGGGKTLSSLRLAKGIQSVRGGDIIVLDSEGGRSKKYNAQIPFKIVELPTTARSDVFLDAINAQLASKPAAIVIDSASDEHEAYLAWHDEEVPKMGGNDWAAWAKPSAARKKLVSGLLKIKVPLIFTFRAREKTKQDGRKVVNIGWQPIASLEIVHTLDLACLLPPRADGVPIWKSDKIGEDFVLKLPNYLAPYIEQGKPLDERMGAAFARWARGDDTASAVNSAAPASIPADVAGAAEIPTAADYFLQWDTRIKNATRAEHIGPVWNGDKQLHKRIGWTDAHSYEDLKGKVLRAVDAMKAPAHD